MALLKGTNLHFLGFRKDVNGNTVIKLRIEGETGFSIQTNGPMPETHALRGKRLLELTEKELLTIAKETVRQIRQFGTVRQNRILECRTDDKFYASL